MAYRKLESYTVRNKQGRDFTLDVWSKGESRILYINNAFWGTFENSFDALKETVRILQVIGNEKFDLKLEIVKRMEQ